MPTKLKHGHRIVTMPDGSKIDCTGMTLGEYLVATDGGKEGLREQDGTWHGAGDFPIETMQYFEWIFKEEKAGFKDYGYDSGYQIKPLLLEHLSTSSPELTVLNMSGRLIKDREMRPVMAALKGNTSVTEIDLSRNVCDLSYLDLAEVLKSNTSVTKLSLKNNDMHDKAILGIAELLSCNTPITYLDLTCNFVRHEAKYIAEAITMNTTLETLILDNCQIEDEGAIALLDACKSSPSIKVFSASNNNVLSKDVRKQLRSWKK